MNNRYENEQKKLLILNDKKVVTKVFIKFFLLFDNFKILFLTIFGVTVSILFSIVGMILFISNSLADPDVKKFFNKF